jgi:hypothetical protein
VGESVGSKDAISYCRYLKKRFSLPVEYRRIALGYGSKREDERFLSARPNPEIARSAISGKGNIVGTLRSE